MTLYAFMVRRSGGAGAAGLGQALAHQLVQLVEGERLFEHRHVLAGGVASARKAAWPVEKRIGILGSTSAIARATSAPSMPGMT